MKLIDKYISAKKALEEKASNAKLDVPQLMELHIASDSQENQQI